MKNLHNNKGFTLVELVVSIAIMALVIIAVSGVMFSNNTVFRKTKSDIYVQDNAQDIYNRINDEVMQAKHIYIEGYVTNTGDKQEFKTTEIGSAVTIPTSNYKTFLLDTDNFILSESGALGESIETYLSGNFAAEENGYTDLVNSMGSAEKEYFTGTNGLMSKTEAEVIEALNNGTFPESNSVEVSKRGTADERAYFVNTYYKLKNYEASDAEKARKLHAQVSTTQAARYDAYRNKYRYLSDKEIDESARFLNKFTTTSDEVFSSLTNSDGTYQNIYITKLIIEYSQDIDKKYLDSSGEALYNSDFSKYKTKSVVNYVSGHNADGTEQYSESSHAENEATNSLGLKDEVTVTYTFGDSSNPTYITAEYDYRYMNKLDTSTSDSDAKIVTKKLNYAKDGTTIVPGCEAQVNAADDSIKLFLYFDENKMSYTDRGMVKIRNSYVLHDAN